MKVSQLQHGETCTLQLKPESLLAPEIAKGQEVRLVFPRSGDEVLLSTETVSSAVDEAPRRHLTMLRETDPARLCWVVARRDNSGGTEVTVQIHRFRSRLDWTGQVSFAVDERVIERVEQIAARRMDSERACQWLAD